jgi:hypothetical protein
VPLAAARPSAARVRRREYLQTQNALLRLVISLLLNIAESPSAMRKMVNKDVVSPLTAVLRRANSVRRDNPFASEWCNSSPRFPFPRNHNKSMNLAYSMCVPG